MKRRLPSPSMIVACVALAVALGGTSYAAVQLSKNSVGSKEIKKGAVKGQDLAPNSITSPKVKDRALKAVDFAKGELPQGPAGPPGPPGAPNPSADTLDGIDSKGFAQVRTVTNLDFTGALRLDVGGFGYFELLCSTKGTLETLDDELVFRLQRLVGGPGLSTGTLAHEESAIPPGAGVRPIVVHHTEPEFIFFQDDQGGLVSGTFRYSEPGGEKLIVVEYGGREDPVDDTCAAHMTARISG